MPVVNFQTNEFCQLNCKFCLYRDNEKLNGCWSLYDFKHAADMLLVEGFDRFDMTPSLGEIFLDRTAIQKLQYIDGRADYIQVYTHGLNLNKLMLGDLMALQSPFTLMFSVYGDTPQTYKEVTGHDEFERFMRTLWWVKELFDTGNVPKHIRIGVDIRFKEVELPLEIRNIDLRNEFWQLAYALQRNENFILINKYENSNWGVDFPDLPNAKEMPSLNGICDCANITLNPNGDAVICDICHPYDERFQILGNVLDDGVPKIIENFRFVLDSMKKGLYPEVCHNCSEYTCEGDTEDYFDGEWKTRPKRNI